MDNLWIKHLPFLRKLNKQKRVIEAVAFSSILYIISVMSKTYNPKNKKRKTTHGFLVRQKTKSGRNVIKKRRQKGRAKLAV